MANATLNTKETTNETKATAPESVTLELTIEEAIALRGITRRIRGSAAHTMRKYSDAIGAHLAEAGIPYVNMDAATGMDLRAISKVKVEELAAKFVRENTEVAPPAVTLDSLSEEDVVALGFNARVHAFNAVKKDRSYNSAYFCSVDHTLANATRFAEIPISEVIAAANRRGFNK